MTTFSKLVFTAAAVLILAVLIIGCGGRANLNQLTPRELFDGGKEQFDKGKHLKAIEYFQAIVYNHPGETLVDTAQYYLAMSYYHNEDFELARVEFNRLTINYPSSAYFQEALFMKAVAAYESTPDHYGLDQSELRSAIAEFEDFIIDFPESDFLGEANRYLDEARARLAHKYYESGVVYMHIGAYTSASIYFQIVIDEFTSSEYAADAMYRLAEAKFKLRQYDEAYQKFADYPVVFPEAERIEEAREKEVEAAFRAAEKAFEAAEYTVAREKLEFFKATYPESKRIEKVDAYLDRLDAIPQDNPTKADVGS